MLVTPSPSRQGKQDRGIKSIELYSKQFKRRWFFLGIGIVLLVIEIFWIAQMVRYELQTPTLQLKARLFLLQYVVTEGVQKEAFFQEAKRVNVDIWPPKGVDIAGDAQQFSDKVHHYLQEEFPDYATLDAESLSLLKFTISDIQIDVLTRIQKGILLDRSLVPEEVLDDHDLLTALTPEYVGFNRYRWHGFEKSLYYIVMPDNDLDHYRIYFASVSDIADKSKFFKSLFLPGCSLLVTAFLILGFTMSSYQRQNQILRLQNEIRNNDSFQGLIETLFRELCKQRSTRCHSCSLQILHGDSFSLITMGQEMGNLQYKHILPLDEQSATARRLSQLEQEFVELFELRAQHKSRKGSYSLSMPLVQEDHVLAFINLNFLSTPTSPHLCFHVNHLIQSINEAFQRILAALAKRREYELEHYRQWLYDHSGISLPDLFQQLGERLKQDSHRSMDFLPPIQTVDGYSGDPDCLMPLFDPAREICLELAADVLKALHQMEESEPHRLFSVGDQMHVLLRLKLPSSPGFVHMIFEENSARLNQLMVEHLANVFDEFVRHVTYYSEKVCRDTAYEELVRIATGLQPEVQEMLKEKVNAFFQIPGNSILSHEEIVSRMRWWMEIYEAEFRGQGYGMLIEMDLRRSTLVKQHLQNDAQRRSYEQAIQEMNVHCFQAFSREGEKFVTPNLSGGDGDGLRFFVTDLNSREVEGKVIPLGVPILEEEKSVYNQRLLKALLETLECTYRQGIPFKLGGLPLQTSDLLRMSFERGAIKIDSDLTGYVEQARFVKGNRMFDPDEEAITLSPDFSSSSFRLIEAPKRIYQPWSVVVPESFQKWAEALIDPKRLSLNTFYTQNHEASASEALKTWLEIRPAHPFPFHTVFLFLCRLPLGWTVSQAATLTSALYAFHEQESSQFGPHDTEAFLRAFCQQQPDCEWPTLGHWLTPVSEKIHRSGLYMTLKQVDLGTVLLPDLQTHLETLLNYQLPQLRFTETACARLETIDEKFLQADPPQKPQLLREANDLYAEYCHQMKWH